MKKILLLFFCCFVAANAHGAFSCGDGYALVESKRIDSINTFQCQRVWCLDLETGKYMGSGDSANSGYRLSGPNELCDNSGNCVTCFGERKWCSGERVGEWNPEYGAYMYTATERSAYLSYQKGSCFGWRLEKPNCPAGQIAVLQGDEYICTERVTTPETAKASSVRRTTSIRKLPR